jgi:hypothetical protein
LFPKTIIGYPPPPPPACQAFSKKIYQNWLLSEFNHEIEAIWLLSQTVRTRFSALSSATLKVALALQKSLFEQRSQRVGRPEPNKPTNLCDLRPRNEKRPAVDLSTPGVNSFGRQSSNSDERILSETLFATTPPSPDIRHRRRFRMHPVARCGPGNPRTLRPPTPLRRCLTNPVF